MPDTKLIQNELLAFVQCFVNQMPKDNVKELIINGFQSTPKVVADAHNLLCTLFKGKPSRTTQVKIDTLTDDIVTMLSSSEFTSKRSEFTFCAVDLFKMPFFAFLAPTKNAVDMSEKFSQVVDIQNQTAAGVAEMLNRVEKLEQKLETIVKLPRASGQSGIPPSFSDVTKRNKPRINRPSVDKSQFRPIGSSFRSGDMNAHENDTFYDADTGDETESKFQVVHNRKKRRAPNSRAPKFVKGTKLNDHVKGGFKYFNAFVYRVHCDTNEGDLKAFITDAGVTMFEFEKQSNESAFTQSFKIRFQSDDYNTVMSPDFWPEGICVRKFYNPRGKMPGKPEMSKQE